MRPVQPLERRLRGSHLQQTVFLYIHWITSFLGEPIVSGTQTAGSRMPPKSIGRRHVTALFDKLCMVRLA